MELERKYLLEEPPEGLSGHPSVHIEQCYVIVTRNEELRVRRKGDSFFLTVKKGTGKARQEVEIGIDAEQYDLFRLQATGDVIRKRRLEYPLGELIAEIDVYEAPLEGLAVVEVEFPSPESMELFSPPSWFGEEVSLLEEFKNRNLALNGFPSYLVERWKGGTRPAWHYLQAGAVPFRKTDRGLEVLLITTRRSGRWIVPKGIIEPDLPTPDSASREAAEEAGASGEVMAGIREVFSYRKWHGTCEVTLFPLLVQELGEHWPEEDVRRRKWVTREGIEDHIENPEMKGAVRRLLSSVATAHEQS